MFLDFFFLLREQGIAITTTEWLTLMAAIEHGLHDSTVKGFYVLCKAVLLHSEIDYAMFDRVFYGYFCGLTEPTAIPEELLSWLRDSMDASDHEQQGPEQKVSREEIEALFRRRLADQKEEHNGGRKWIGTYGYTAYGNSGLQSYGIRVGDKSGQQSAYRGIGEKHYRDWRKDTVLDDRQMYFAIRMLRQQSVDSNMSKTELDLEATIRKTCDAAGNLRIEYGRPRRNSIRLLMLIDSGGSMERYQTLCIQLFRAVQKTGGFRELRTFFFHNTIKGLLYTDPSCDWRSGVPVEQVLNSLETDHRLIIVGDAMMAPDELTDGIDYFTGIIPKESGLGGFLEFKEKCPHAVWFHPQDCPERTDYFTRSFGMIGKYFYMHQLTLNGLQSGMKHLLSNR